MDAANDKFAVETVLAARFVHEPVAKKEAKPSNSPVSGPKKHARGFSLCPNQPRGNGGNSRRFRLVAALSVILAVAAGGILAYSSGIFREGPVMLVISAKGQSVVSRPLKQIAEGTIPVEGILGTTIVEVKQGRVHVLSSPCENHICMNTGWISNPGQIIVCLPNEVVVRLVKE